MNNYEIVIRLVSNRKPTRPELEDFFFCRIRDRDLKYTIHKIYKRDGKKKGNTKG